VPLGICLDIVGKMSQNLVIDYERETYMANIL